MTIWSSEIKELEKLHYSIKEVHPKLDDELQRLIKTDDENMVLVYARRCLEVMITDLCELELKRARGTEPLKGIIDKLNREEKVPHNIIISMQNLNSLSTLGAHPKDFDPRQVKPVLLDLTTVLEWYMKYLEAQSPTDTEPGIPGEIQKKPAGVKKVTASSKKWILLASTIVLVPTVIVVTLILTDVINGGKSVKAGEIKSLVVLPFENYTGADTLEYFVSGMHSSLIQDMGRISSLLIPGSTTSKVFKGANKTIAQITSELHVDAALETSVVCLGEDTICFQTRLIKPGREEEQLWINDYRIARNQILNWYNGVTKQIAEEVKVNLTPQEEVMLAESKTVNPEAYEAYLKGQFYLNIFTPDALDSAMQYFELAKEIDPDYALAYTGISQVWGYRKQWGLISPAEGIPKRMEALMRAYALDSNNAEVQSILAGQKTWDMFDWAGGESGYKKSISLNPNNAKTHAMYSHLLNILGKPEEALEQIDIALKLDPMNPFIITFNGVDIYMARKYDEAIRAFNDALSLEPGYPFALCNLWQSYYMVGRAEEAYNTLKSFWSMDPESLKSLEQGYLKDGYRGAFLYLADRLGELWIDNQNQFFAPTDIAMLYSAGHETDKSIYWLEQAYNFRDPNIPYLLIPVYDNVRNDSRFKDLCQRMKLPC